MAEPGASPRVSIVVPTRDRLADLERCLRALSGQVAVDDREVVVVDDGSRDGAAVTELVARFPAARVVRLSGAGPAAARNAGVGAARGALVLLTDDDCAPAPDWAARMVARLGDGCEAVAGRTFNARRRDPFAEATQLISNHLMESSLRSGERPPFATSNNLACLAALLRSVPFDPRYPQAGGEDRDWCARVAAQGTAIAFEPAALVGHHHRLGPVAFWRKHVLYGRGARRFRRDHPPAGRTEAPAFYAGLVRRGFRAGLLTGLLVCAAQGATATGILLELLDE